MKLRIILDRPHQELLTYARSIEMEDVLEADLVNIEVGTALAFGAVSVPKEQLIDSLKRLGII